jgi:hypothetical protein
MLESSPEFEEPEVIERGHGNKNNNRSTRRNLSEWERPAIQKMLPKSLRITKRTKGTITTTITPPHDEEIETDVPTASKKPKRARGRPKGSKNKPKSDAEEIMHSFIAEMRQEREKMRVELENTLRNQISSLNPNEILQHTQGILPNPS